ncbi:HD domain-containing protein [Lacticigenium naphthae]|uniref:HD domain-containing protein n=1 Tax=Lacticigenium naphthae TaxID=515351 RepID=UPI00040829FC|nr:HD domain-containing protein [Lacticigenium naphthae]
MQFVESFWNTDTEYIALIEDLLENSDLIKLGEITHHHFTTRLTHSLFVSYVSYRIAKRFDLDTKAVARAGLLHDFFHEGRAEIAEMKQGSHNYVHPKIAVNNAEKITLLNDIEKDIILKHMFLTTKCGLPKYKESFIVTMVDKYCAIHEVSSPIKNIAKTRILSYVGKINPVSN